MQDIQNRLLGDEQQAFSDGYEQRIKARDERIKDLEFRLESMESSRDDWKRAHERSLAEVERYKQKIDGLREAFQSVAATASDALEEP